MEQVFSYIISLGASVMMPIIFTIIGLCIGMKFGKALKSGLFVGVGFVGLGVVTALLTTNFNDPLKAISDLYHLQLNVFDMGWPAAAAVAYNTAVGALIIPICLGVNFLMLITKTTRTVNIDLWNYWHFAFIGVDVMVGCRGETPECFEECYEFLKSLPVTQLHVFPYSERPGTAALKIPYVVSDKEKKLRSKRLLELSDQKTQEFYAQYIGTEAEVLFEKAPRGKAMHGFTKNYVRVELSPALAKEEYDNQLLRVRLGDFNHDKTALKAELL